MDFYVFLPSNASPQVYPGNKTSHFQTELSQRMELHGRWQVALIELHYPNTIAQVVAGDNEITLQSDSVIDTTYVKARSYVGKADFLKGVQQAFEAFDTDDKILVQETEAHRVIIHPMTDEMKDTKLWFSPRLALQLGLDNEGPYSCEEKIYGLKPVELCLGIPPQLYVYMDILADQIIGHSRAPLLRTVPVDITAPYGTMTVYHCDHPIYSDLNTKSFDTVKIDIRDHTGRYVPFDFGTSTLVVHFRQLPQ